MLKRGDMYEGSGPDRKLLTTKQSEEAMSGLYNAIAAEAFGDAPLPTHEAAEAYMELVAHDEELSEMYPLPLITLCSMKVKRPQRLTRHLLREAWRARHYGISPMLASENCSRG